MPINNVYEEYKENMKKVEMVKDFFDGNEGVKEGGEKYLPILSGQSFDRYKAYKLRGFVLPAVKTTLVAIVGSIMRKKAVFNNDNVSYLYDNVDGNGKNITQFSTHIISELLLSGAVGLLTEYTDNTYIKTYNKENIINISDNFIVLTQEYKEVDNKDKYKIKSKKEYLELTFDEYGYYIQNIWRKVANKLTIVKTFAPTSMGERLNYIPFNIVSSDENKGINSDPLLLNLANVNADQYRMSTDLRHGLHWTALPTLFLFGDLTDDDGEKIKINVGVGSSNHIQDSDARAELLEFTGNGLSALKSAIDDVVKIMAGIGAKMLSDGTKGVKSAETSRIESSAETAMLTTIANSLDDGINKALSFITKWNNVGEVKYSINRDFIDIKLDPQELLAWLTTWQSGGISLGTFLHQLNRGEALPEGTTIEDEINNIESGGINSAFKDVLPKSM